MYLIRKLFRRYNLPHERTESDEKGKQREAAYLGSRRRREKRTALSRSRLSLSNIKGEKCVYNANIKKQGDKKYN